MKQDPVENPPIEGEAKTVEPSGPPIIDKDKVEKGRTELIITIALLAAVMLLGAIAIKWLSAWRRKQVEPGRWEVGIELNNFREMLETGEITKSEYEKIREKMSTKIKKEVGISRITPPQKNDEKPKPPINPNQDI